MREWVETELKAVLIEAELQENLAAGLLRSKIAGVVERLRTIRNTDLPEAVRDFDEVIDDISDGGHTDILDVHGRLERGSTALVQIMRELLEIRSFIGEMG